MVIFLYTFVIVFVALVVILGLGGLLAGVGEETEAEPEGAATAAMCTTQLLGRGSDIAGGICDECAQTNVLKFVDTGEHKCYTVTTVKCR